ncbi:MAG: universal stress protein [Gammaproteobacteria bacterium]
MKTSQTCNDSVMRISDTARCEDVMKPLYIQSLTAGAAQPILVPVDFSPASGEAVLFAAHLAECSALPLMVLHVVHEDMQRGCTYPRENDRDILLPIEDIAERMLRDFMKKIHELHPDNAILANAVLMVTSGLPVTRISEIAHLKDAGLIVMSGNGRSSLSRLLTSSISEKIARHCDLPVAIIHARGNCVSASRM